jgi:hypothetical protein
LLAPRVEPPGLIGLRLDFVLAAVPELLRLLSNTARDTRPKATNEIRKYFFMGSSRVWGRFFSPFLFAVGENLKIRKSPVARAQKPESVTELAPSGIVDTLNGQSSTKPYQYPMPRSFRAVPAVRASATYTFIRLIRVR